MCYSSPTTLGGMMGESRLMGGNNQVNRFGRDCGKNPEQLCYTVQYRALRFFKTLLIPETIKIVVLLLELTYILGPV